jgi:hypothetical protein
MNRNFMNFVHLPMPKRKANTIIEDNKDKEQIKSDQKPQISQGGERNATDSKIDLDIETRASELSSRIIRELYRHYGAKDSHTNKHLYKRVIFEVAKLSGKPLNEVMNNWPKFDIFSISDKIKEVVTEEIKNEPTIMYQMVMNSNIIADRILAKVIAKSMI